VDTVQLAKQQSKYREVFLCWFHILYNCAHMYNEYLNVNLKKKQTIDFHRSKGDMSVITLVITFKR
jgi:hypothetical protein